MMMMIMAMIKVALMMGGSAQLPPLTVMTVKSN